MEIGFFFWPYDPGLVRRMAEAADRFGYDMIGIADTPGNAMDPWIAATMVAEACESARVALCVTNLVSRGPAVSAASIASLDRLAEGRCVLGIGAGHSGTRNLGLARSTLGEIEDGIGHIKTLLRGEPATLDGGTAHIPWVTGAPQVFLAGSGPRTLALAGAVADGAFINYGITAETMARSERLVTDRRPILARRFLTSSARLRAGRLGCQASMVYGRRAGLPGYVNIRVDFTVWFSNLRFKFHKRLPCTPSPKP